MISHMISHDIARYFMIYHYDTVYFSKFPTQWRTHTFCSFLRLLHHSFLPRQLFFGTKESPIWEIMDGLPEVYPCIMVVYGSRTQRYRYNDTYLQNCNGGSISQNHCPIYHVCTWYWIEGFKEISIKRESQEVVCWPHFMHNLYHVKNKSLVPSITIHRPITDHQLDDSKTCTSVAWTRALRPKVLAISNAGCPGPHPRSKISVASRTSKPPSERFLATRFYGGSNSLEMFKTSEYVYDMIWRYDMFLIYLFNYYLWLVEQWWNILKS